LRRRIQVREVPKNKVEKERTKRKGVWDRKDGQGEGTKMDNCQRRKFRAKNK
jgi:hypothetical protein